MTDGLTMVGRDVGLLCVVIGLRRLWRQDILQPRNCRMASLLRLIAIVGTALLILGWSVAAAQTDRDIEPVARQYRIGTYQKYRHDRKTYDQRIALAQQLLDRWHARGATPDEAALVIGWFNQAQTAARLPPLPLPGQHRSQEPTWDDLGDVIIESMPAIPLGVVSAAPASSSTVVLSRPALRPKRHLATVAPIPRPAPAAELGELLAAGASTVPDTLRDPSPAAAWRSVSGPPRSAPASTTSSAQVRPGATAAVKPTRQNVRIDVNLLRQRIVDHNLSVRALQDQLETGTQWRLSNIELAVDRLDYLTQQRELWSLYTGIVESGQQPLLGQFEPFDRSYELLEQRLDKARDTYQAVAPLTHKQAQVLARLLELTKKVQRWKTTL